MFKFRRRSKASRRATELGRLLHHLVSCVETQPFDAFVEARLREGVTQSYLDLTKREFGFFESGPQKGEFSYHTTYDPLLGASLVLEGHGQYYGLMIIGSKLGDGISVDISEIITAGLGNAKLGRDATLLQAELLRFPGFHSPESLRAQLLG